MKLNKNVILVAVLAPRLYNLNFLKTAKSMSYALKNSLQNFKYLAPGGPDKL